MSCLHVFIISGIFNSLSVESKGSNDMSNQEIEELLSRRMENKRKEGNENEFQPKSKRRKRYQIEKSGEPGKRKTVMDRVEPKSKKIRLEESKNENLMKISVFFEKSICGRNHIQSKTKQTKVSLT